MALPSRTRLCWVLLLTLLPLSASALELKFSAHGRLRYRHIGLTDFALDANGFEHGQQNRGTALLRIRPELSLSEQLFVKSNIQIADAQIYGDDSLAGGSEVIVPWRDVPFNDQFLLRELYLQVPVGIGVLRVGRQVSRWGLGMIANTGDEEVFPFADASHGDISERLMFITKPAKPFTKGRAGDAIVLALAGDIINRDELTKTRDTAWQVIGVLTWRETDLEVGTYIVYRHHETDVQQVTRDTDALAVDLYARWQHVFARRFRLELAYEGAYIDGTTEQARFEGARFPLDVRQFGQVFRADLEDKRWGYTATLEVGYAGGDNNNGDGTARAFRFDPGYKVGMILFEEVLNRTSARSFDHVTDPNLAGRPPEGAQLVPTNGSITNALYINPRVHYKHCLGPELDLGLLFAFAPADVADPFQTAQAGGFNRNVYKKPGANGYMGMELNLGVALPIHVKELFTFRLGAQYGLFLPGPALDSAEGSADLGTLHKWRLLADLNW